jgi:CBS domain-containing protein
MLVKDIMTSGVVTVAADELLEQAGRRMREANVGVLAVCDDERPIGILTDRDIVVRSTAEGQDPRRARVRDAMTPQVVACSDSDGIEAAVAEMRRHAIRRLLVVDAAERLVGILSVDDVALRSPALAGEVIEHALAPDRPDPSRTWAWRE